MNLIQTRKKMAFGGRRRRGAIQTIERIQGLRFVQLYPVELRQTPGDPNLMAHFTFLALKL
jgi:hypothetical protein